MQHRRRPPCIPGSLGREAPGLRAAQGGRVARGRPAAPAAADRRDARAAGAHAGRAARAAAAGRGGRRCAVCVGAQHAARAPRAAIPGRRGRAGARACARDAARRAGARWRQQGEQGALHCAAFHHRIACCVQSMYISPSQSSASRQPRSRRARRRRLAATGLAARPSEDAPRKACRCVRTGTCPKRLPRLGAGDFLHRTVTRCW